MLFLVSRWDLADSDGSFKEVILKDLLFRVWKVASKKVNGFLKHLDVLAIILTKLWLLKCKV